MFLVGKYSKRWYFLFSSKNIDFFKLSKNKSLNVFELHLKDGSTIRDKEISARIVEQFVPHKK